MKKIDKRQMYCPPTGLDNIEKGIILDTRYSGQTKVGQKHIIDRLKGFTLVELIIVITILAILATIAFISFQGYTKNARDSNRTATISNLQKGIDIYSVQVGNIPEPDGNILTGSVNGILLNKVGIIGDKISKVINLSSLSIDPLGGNNYAYGISADNKYYQIGVTLENPESYNTITKTTYADNGNYRAKVVGNYKYPLKYNGKLYSLPSLLFTGNGGELTQSGNAYFIINNGENIPYTPDKSTLNNTQTTTLVLQSITGTGNLVLTGITLPTETSEQFKTLTSTSTTIQNLQQALGITDQTQLGNVIYGTSYNTNLTSNVSNGGSSSGGGGTQIKYLQNCTKKSSDTSLSGGIIYTDSSGIEIGRVTNTGVTISGNPDSLTCAGNIIVCAGSGTGYILSACNVGATTTYTGQTFTSTTTARDSTVNAWAGGLYQWGRDEDVSTGTYVTSTYVGTLINSKVGNNNFYKGDASYGDWWQTEVGSSSPTRWTGTNVQSLCGTGYHIPTGGASGEWQAIYNDGGWSSVSSNKGTALSNSLKLPFAGYRNWDGGTMLNQGASAHYWSATPYTSYAYSLVFNASGIYPANNFSRGRGFSLRCIRN